MESLVLDEWQVKLDEAVLAHSKSKGNGESIYSWWRSIAPRNHLLSFLNQEHVPALRIGVCAT